jgi:hypothetical protein
MNIQNFLMRVEIMEQIKPFKFIEAYDKMTVDKLNQLTDEEYHKYRAYCIKKKEHLKKGKK